MKADYVVVGGGVVGLSICYGLLKRGKRVICVDGSDNDFRASRGNFGLVWVQSKGIDAPHYAQWTRRSVKAYPEFVAQLKADSGMDVFYQFTGGYEYFLDSDEMAERVEQFSSLRDKLEGDYPFELFDAERIRAEEPMVGPAVVGATYYPEDGHINPLQLLHALSAACHNLGLRHLTSELVEDIEHKSGFALQTAKGTRVEADKLVLAAGLGAAKLGPKLGFKAEVVPQRGQVLVTEKLPSLINRPSLRIRQVNEGAIQIGDSKEAVGYDDHENAVITAKIAQHAIGVMPFLENIRLVRTWGALRVMSRDGLPVYQRSKRYSGASLVTCHSGITLAATHATGLIDWLESSESAPDLGLFGEARFE